MTPERKEIVGDWKVEEYYWAGDYICYANNRLSSEPFDETVKRLKNGEAPIYQEPYAPLRFKR